jgi:hypothetical protein
MEIAGLIAGSRTQHVSGSLQSLCRSQKVPRKNGRNKNKKMNVI